MTGETVASETATAPRAVITQLQAIFDRDTQADRVALVWPTPLVPDALVQQVSGHAVKLVHCPSELAMREHLVHHQGPERLVLLSAFNQAQLGKDVLARLWGQEPQQISPWRTLQQLIRVREIDPRLPRRQGRWMAEALLDCHDRYRDVMDFGEVLDLDAAWLALARGYLDYRERTLELPLLFRWSLQPDVERHLQSLPPEMHEHLADWFNPALPVTGPAITALFTQGHGQDLLAAGLACAVMHDQDLEGRGVVPFEDLHAGRVRFMERYLGGARIPQRALAELGIHAQEAARSLLNEAGIRGVSASLDKAEQILLSLDLAPALITSDLLPGGWRQRLSAFAKALGKDLKRGNVQSTQVAWEALSGHDLARRSFREGQLERAQMALRLLRWLAREEPVATDSADAGLRHYMAEGSFVDWARSQMWAGEDDEALNQAYRDLLQTVTMRREQQNRAFATHLPAIARGDTLPAGLWPVEAALARVVAPIAQGKPVLLVVLDGMSAAVYRELQEDLQAHGWIEVSDTPDQPESALVAALPSLTRVSRCALLCGALRTGEAADEKKGFAEHPVLKKVGSSRFPARLLHKQDLQQPGTGALAPEARAMLAGTEHRVTAVVINAVDDQLSSSSQVSVAWSLQSVSLLREVLGAAREGERAVIITSDHGHVLDHDASFLQADHPGGERYREQADTPDDVEVMLEGPRVLTSDQRVVVPWSEKPRYTKARSRGYHGGASLQEIAIPLGVYINAADGHGLPGWTELPRRVPPWWAPVASSEETHAPGQKAPEPAPARTRGKGRPSPAEMSGQGDLFASEPESVASPVTDALREGAEAEAPSWLTSLLASPVYAQARARAGGRASVTEAQLIQLLALLEESGGAAMEATVAQRLAIPAIRLRGFLSSAQKLLNVEGYPVLTVQRDARTVRLNLANLKEQFEL